MLRNEVEEPITEETVIDRVIDAIGLAVKSHPEATAAALGAALKVAANPLIASWLISRLPINLLGPFVVCGRLHNVVFMDYLEKLTGLTNYNSYLLHCYLMRMEEFCLNDYSHWGHYDVFAASNVATNVLNDALVGAVVGGVAASGASALGFFSSSDDKCDDVTDAHSANEHSPMPHKQRQTK